MRRMILQPSALAVAAIALIAACSQMLGFQDVKLDDSINSPGLDAAIDGASASRDAAQVVIDGAPAIDASLDAPAIDAAPSNCVPAACPFGCDATTNACRDGKLWIFKTQGAFLGNTFGGADTPPNVRGGADGKCLATYAALYSDRQCNSARVHAILHVSGADSLALMATSYGIPSTVPVNRAEDNVLVASTWNDLIDPARAPRAPATTAATDAEGIVWTGTNTVATCRNWTSGGSADSGMRGYSNRTDVTWLSQDTFRCDRPAGLLCICWSGGE